ncbi:hypothetical protein PPL_00692 [Heterostelium album PN500]|uniref:Uncharacterized protein n=1 Tax=Heterostelium pallidum (strain ATCC 26659 / Pp 5 / PN500) TaxID=670386 RepID=D3AX63_HETP5|nr:hypothetical protein PPL_00692 [Heterostelium album PN500]EFA86132.1 hypothetical protein PPL_00692 [Heterostelium album PN500]|eukprot:XP_020438237.1 hypothetical protein PPL_00692 [Heterostelium album PN500]
MDIKKYSDFESRNLHLVSIIKECEDRNRIELERHIQDPEEMDSESEADEIKREREEIEKEREEIEREIEEIEKEREVIERETVPSPNSGLPEINPSNYVPPLYTVVHQHATTVRSILS